ncbi:N-acetylmuramoyl-L-alanine amidase [Candidatus Uabimicrobium sp. HlEnr_7]|uniref:N-acetylmuramoyl-L-alanine amidase n=1 Tax=Candidatus Uabimicrobium helgolandensis TaxID=3095367 RepID=UPI00355628F6
MRVCIISLLFVLSTNIFAHDELQYTDRFTAQKMTRCQCEKVTLIDGSIQLYPETSSGKLTSDSVQSKMFFNAATINYFADIPQGASIQFEISALNRNFEWSEWKQIHTSEADVHFKETNQAYRYRVIFEANSEGQSPQLNEVQVCYDFVFPHMTVDALPSRMGVRGVTKPSVISRRDWGARPAKKGYSYHSPRRLTIHHTYRPLASSFKGASTIRSIQNYHMDSNGWSDIGYHFLIGTYSSGKTVVYQGRPENVLGAHTGGANTNNVGVNLIGDYDLEKVNPNGYKAMINVLAWLCDRYNVNPNEIYGHKDFSNTACPGQGLYSRIPQIKRDVRNILNGGSGNETGTLIGAVYDSAKGSSVRLSGATVTLNNGKKIVTGSDGVFRFQIKPGTYNYTISKSGYKTSSASRSVQANETTWGSVGLSK